MISAVAWVKKGATRELPTRYTHDETLVDAPEQEDEVMGDDSIPAPPPVLDAEMKEIYKKYNLEDYSDEEADLCFVPPVFHQKGDKDPLISNDAEDDEDIDDLMIKETDTVLLAATTEEDQFSHVNVYVYEAEQTNLYIHHDIVLPSFPLCIEWMEYHPPSSTDADLVPTGTTNTLAVGTFNPEIEIWDLDLMDALTPCSVLGGIEDEQEQADDVAGFARLSAKQKKRKKKKMAQRSAQRSLKVGSHTDAVMALSWNTGISNILASGSADHTVKIWDMNTQACLNTYTHHSEKVQSCCWHPSEPNLLLSASYDKSAAIIDIRTPSEVYRWKLTADVEKVEWNPHRVQEFLVSTEDGVVKKFDSLAPTNTLFTLHAHSGGVGGLSLNKVVPDCLATCSDDKSFKIWDIKDNKPSLIFENDHAGAQLFALSWDRNSPNLLVVGGRGHLQVVDVSKVDIITNHFSLTRTPKA